MKQFYYYLLIFITFASPNISFPVINELVQFQQNLQRLTQFISKVPVIPPPLKPVPPHIEITYEKLKDAVDNSKLDKYKQTIAITTAKYLIEEFEKEQLTEGKSKTHIPFIAFMVQQIIEKYPKIDTTLNCVSLDDKQNLEKESVLENEFLLIRALVHLGYKNIQIIYMNPYKGKFSDDELKTKFATWINKNISQISQKNIRLLLIQDDEHVYISRVTREDFPKNNLFFMIESKNITKHLRLSAGQTAPAIIGALNKSLRTNIGRPNFLEFVIAGPPLIAFYLPFKSSDWFLKTLGYIDKEKEKKVLQMYSNFIRNLPEQAYQKRLEGIVKEIVEKEKDLERIDYGIDIDLLFCDLIRYTAVNLNEPLAFRSLKEGREMTQITDMSGSLQEIYDRYKR